MLADNEDVLES